MAELSDDYVKVLTRVRGEFENTKGGKIGNRILAHVFSSLFPVILLSYFIFWSNPQWPLRGEQSLFVVMAGLTFGMGLALHRSINSKYVFNEEGVEEYRATGKLKQLIRRTGSRAAVPPWKTGQSQRTPRSEATRPTATTSA